MSLTLQPMTTAPRDGREFYVQFKNGEALWPAEHVDADRLRVDHIVLPVSAFSGWLDIEALVRDSERLDRIESEGLTVQRRQGPASIDGWAVLKDAKIVTTGATARAAIDKEAGRGT